jgi:hypothetical protein
LQHRSSASRPALHDAELERRGQAVADLGAILPVVLQ